MIRALTAASALILALTLGATIASAEEMEDCTDRPQANWLTEDAAKARAAEVGYDVRDLKIEGSCYEIYALKDGERVEVVMDPSNGEIVGNETGDE